MDLQKFKKYLSNNPFAMENRYINEIIKKFSFYIVTDENTEIIQNLQRKSKFNIIIIDKLKILQNDRQSEDLLIICFDYTLFILSLSDISLILPKEKSIIYCISENIEDNIKGKIDTDHYIFSKPNYIFIYEIQSLTRNFENNLRKCSPEIALIHSSLRVISGFLIQVAHQNSQIDRRQQYEELFFIKEKELENDIKEDEYGTDKANETF